MTKVFYRPQLNRCWVSEFVFYCSVFLLIFGVRLSLIHAFGVQTPYWDEWGMGGYLANYVNQGFDWSKIANPTNSHRFAFNSLISTLLFDMNQQQWDPLVSMVSNALIWSAIGVFLIRIIRLQNVDLNTRFIVGMVLLLWLFPTSLVNALWGMQTHTYTMILFSVLGCWWVTKPSGHIKWYLSFILLFFASLTLSGGAMAAVAVSGVYCLLFFFKAKTTKPAIATIVFSSIAAAAGLTLLFIQPSSSYGGGEFSLANATSSFTLALAWPRHDLHLPALIFAAPVLILLKRVLIDKVPTTRFIEFIFCLYAFIVCLAIAIGFARAGDGGGPARRYMEYLSLAVLVSSFALCVLQCKSLRLSKHLNYVLIFSWFLTFLSGFPLQSYIVQETIKEREYLKPIQENTVKSYLHTLDRSHLDNKGFQHVPFPNIDNFIKLLDRMVTADTLPYDFQVRPELKHSHSLTADQIKESPFTKNGTLMASTNTIGTKLIEEDIIGSYMRGPLGMKGVGKFVSNEFELLRPYVAVPIIGYLGYPSTSLTLVNERAGVTIPIVPQEIGSKFAEKWRNIIVEIPRGARGTYRLIAEDLNDQIWIGFAPPRTVGRMSYLTHRLLNNAHYFWQLGVILLLLILVPSISSTLSKRENEHR